MTSFQHDPLRLTNSVSTRQKYSGSQSASKLTELIVLPETDGTETLDISGLGNQSSQKAGTYAKEKKSKRPTSVSEFKILTEDSTDNEHMPGATCSPELATSSSPIIQQEMEPDEKFDERPVSKEEKFKHILKSKFTVAREQDDKTQRQQAETIERLKMNHAQEERKKSQAETKSKIANLFSQGLLDNKIKHLEDKTAKPIDFELSQSLLEKMNDVVVRRMNDPNFEGQKFAIKLSTGSPTKSQKKNISAACLKNFDFDGFEPIFSGKLIKFDDVTRSSYHNEQMLKIQNRKGDQQKAQRKQLIQNVFSKSDLGPTLGALHVGKAALPPLISALPKQEK